MRSKPFATVGGSNCSSKQQLSDDEQAAFEEHLSECETCRRALDARAADAGAWREARESLSSGESFADQGDVPSQSDR